jgi:ER lumen protein retaining receptor
MINILQLIGDLLHLLSFIIIIYKIYKDKSCKGVSAKTFEIYLIVFCTRYLDLFMYFINLYNTLMKIFFICVTAYILYLMHFQNPYKSTYNRKNEDIFPHKYLIVFAVIITFLCHKEFSLWGLTWSFSLWLESVAVFPQITILANNNGVENYTAHYLASLGAYRFFYILLWIYRYIYYNYLSWVSILSGTLQVLLYVDFFYLYLNNFKNSLTSDLPVTGSVKKEDTKSNIF